MKYMIRMLEIGKRMVRLASLVACLTLALVVAGADSGGTLNVTLNGLELHIDKQTGSIVYLSYPATGVILKTSPEFAGLVDLAYPTEAFAPLRLASRFSRAQVSEEKNGVRIAWDALGPSRTNVPLSTGQVVPVPPLAGPTGAGLKPGAGVSTFSPIPLSSKIFPSRSGNVFFS